MSLRLIAHQTWVKHAVEGTQEIDGERWEILMLHLVADGFQDTTAAASVIIQLAQQHALSERLQLTIEHDRMMIVLKTPNFETITEPYYELTRAIDVALFPSA